MPDVSVDLVTNAVEDIEGAAEDSISSSWKSQGLALLQVERYLILHSMVIHLSQNLNFVL
ncbi:Prolow-density lipoprotein receptor-related 1 [Gossypium arboreum]|uniref:Prolow-density lipoprotein receptor-related 1 n=2 Tax=Gossypium TaxID=3633 RepID=A0A0B0MDN8_GOSAR|nr:Prolow-density lipoprotein receptor-related 1 [Gossypium arboreum]